MARKKQNHSEDTPSEKFATSQYEGINDVGMDSGRLAYEKVREARQQHVQKRKRRRVAVLAGALVIILAVSWAVSGLAKAWGDAGNIAVSGGNGTNGSVAEITEEQWNFIGPVEQTINATGLVAPNYRMIALPENGAVDIGYFNGVTFLGDSITQGLQLYKEAGLPEGTKFCAYMGISPRAVYDGTVAQRVDRKKEVVMEALVASAPDSLYILLGANAMVNLTNEAIVEYYAEMIVQVKANLHPGVRYYIQSITPVRPDNKNGFTKENIDSLNNQLAKLAYDHGVYFVDLGEVLAGDDGYLREEYAYSDGLHMKPDGYAAWVQYLVTHTAYHPSNPYLPGSPYYVAPPQ